MQSYSEDSSGALQSSESKASGWIIFYFKNMTPEPTLSLTGFRRDDITASTYSMHTRDFN